MVLSDLYKDPTPSLTCTMWSSPDANDLNPVPKEGEWTGEYLKVGASASCGSPEYPSPSSASPKSSDSGQPKNKGSGTHGKSIEEELCMICGDRASGYHYNALSCEGCKGFFRRSITRGAQYTCKQGGNCEMDMWMRRRCQFCRLRRCKEVGMKEECLLSDEQCKARDVRRKIKLAKKRPVKPEVEEASPDSNLTTAETLSEDSQGSIDIMDQLPEAERNLIYTIVQNQDAFELPKTEDIQQVTRVRVSDIGRPKQLNETIYKQMAEMTILVTQLVVEFAKHLPGFSNIDKDDQICLLKGSSSELMMMRSARRYDLESDTIIFGNGMPYTRQNMRFAGLSDYVETLFEFCRKMGSLAVDNAEYALLTSICIFADRPGLKYPQQVEKCQEKFVDALRKYVNVRRNKKQQYLAKLLMMLTELREASVEHAAVLFSLKIEKGSLPPLLSEYFDVV